MDTSGQGKSTDLYEVKVRIVHDTSGNRSQGDVTDRPSPAITVGVKSLCSHHYHVEYYMTDKPPIMPESKPSSKPPYKVPLMSEIAALPHNGYYGISTFSGAGGSSLGYKMAGFKILWANEFIPAAQETYRANHPTTILDTRDIRKVHASDILKEIGMVEGQLDLFDGSPPCFAAGTPVLTDRGYIPVETVVVGDKVLTHKMRWREVTHTMSRKANTILVDGRIECTPDHRFWVRGNNLRQRDKDREWLSNPSWVPASDVCKKWGATPNKVDDLPSPEPPEGFTYTHDFWWMIGRWIGDGWLRIESGDESPQRERKAQNISPVPCVICGKPSRPNDRCPGLYTNYCSKECRGKWMRQRKRPRNVVLICCGKHEKEIVAARLQSLCVPIGIGEERTTYRFSISRKSLAEWLLRYFRSGAAYKTIPAFVYSMPEEWRRSLFDGYLSADGHKDRERCGITSISRCLAASAMLLGQTLGFTTAFLIRKRLSNTIEGRICNVKNSYQVQFAEDDGRYTEVEDRIRWRRIRRQNKEGQENVTVYDLTVAEDSSFVADGYAVHNCASFSTAGKREKGWGQVKAYSDTVQRTDDLFFEFTRLIKGVQPKVFVAENVSGLVKGSAKGYFLEILKAMKDCGYTVKAQLLDAQWLGVPQMRQRIIYVGVRNDLVAKYGVQPTHPSPLPYRYSVRDAIPWVVKVRYSGHVDNWKDASVPAGTVVQSDATTSPTAYLSAGGWVEAETDISRFAIGEEWDNVAMGKRSGKYFNLRRPDLDLPSPTITGSGGNSSTAAVAHPTEKRKFSIAELRRICGFPDDFILTGSYQQQWERLGRAVPPVMMSHIARSVQSILDKCQ